jgi:hypothetical protein
MIHCGMGNIGVPPLMKDAKPTRPKSSAVVIVGACFVFGNLAIFVVESLKGLQIKAHSTNGVDPYDFSILLAGLIGCVAINVAAFMNQSYSRLKEALEKHDTEMHKLTETEFIRQEIAKDKKLKTLG